MSAPCRSYDIAVPFQLKADKAISRCFRWQFPSPGNVAVGFHPHEVANLAATSWSIEQNNSRVAVWSAAEISNVETVGAALPLRGWIVPRDPQYPVMDGEVDA